MPWLALLLVLALAIQAATAATVAAASTATTIARPGSGRGAPGRGAFPGGWGRRPFDFCFDERGSTPTATARPPLKRSTALSGTARRPRSVRGLAQRGSAVVARQLCRWIAAWPATPSISWPKAN